MSRPVALVTGADGFVGRHLTERLDREGFDVVPLTRSVADLADRAETQGFVRAVAPDVVVHAAAARDARDEAARAATTAVNALSGMWVVEAVPASCRAVVRLGSSTEYAASDLPLDELTPGPPRGFFGGTKAAGSLLMDAAGAARGLRVTHLRAFQVYGPGDKPRRFVPSVLRAARTGEVLPLTGAGRCRDWVYVEDVVDAVLLALDADGLQPGEVLNIGTGTETSNEQLVAVAETVTGRRIRTQVGACPDRSWDAAHWRADPRRAEHLLGWRASTPLADGLRRCWQAEVGEHRGSTAA